MTARPLPEWIANVPMKTVGVLCAVNIFGKNIESRQITLAGKRYFHNAAENVINYALNPILPTITAAADALPGTGDAEAEEALRNVRDCFNYIFHIQIEYFKLLQRVKPRAFVSRNTGREFNLNQFSAKSPTLINSEKRYLILSKIDGAQPYDLDLDWDADLDWVEDAIRDNFERRLASAQDAYADTLALGEWYNTRERNLILPLKTMLDDLSEYFACLSQAAYYMARRRRVHVDRRRALIKENLLRATSHLERFTTDMLRVNVFSIVKHDMDRLGEDNVMAVINARAEDDSRSSEECFESLRETYSAILSRLYRAIDFKPAAAAHPAAAAQ